MSKQNMQKLENEQETGNDGSSDAEDYSTSSSSHAKTSVYDYKEPNEFGGPQSKRKKAPAAAPTKNALKNRRWRERKRQKVDQVIEELRNAELLRETLLQENQELRAKAHSLMTHFPSIQTINNERSPSMPFIPAEGVLQASHNTLGQFPSLLPSSSVLSDNPSSLKITPGRGDEVERQLQRSALQSLELVGLPSVNQDHRRSLLHEMLLAGRQQELLRYQDTQSSQQQVSTASGIFDLPVNKLDLIDLLQHHGLAFTTNNHSPLASEDSPTIHHPEALPHLLTLLPQAQPLTSVHETDQSQRGRQHATSGNINTDLQRSQYYAFFNTLPLPGTASGDLIRAIDSFLQQNPLSILRLRLNDNNLASLMTLLQSTINQHRNRMPHDNRLDGEPGVDLDSKPPFKK